MKFLVLLGDGMADFPLDACGGKTPLAAAHTPAMDNIAAEGMCGLFCPIPENYPAGSDIGNMSIFGYDPDIYFTGRAPLEAANQGISLGPDQIAFRCNLVTLVDGKMEDFTAGHIGNEEAQELISFLNERMGDAALVFHSGVSYRHLAIVTPPAQDLEALVSISCTPPHDILGQSYSTHLPRGSGADYLHKLMERSRALLSDHPVNDKRTAAGQAPATSIWLWGQGQAPTLETYHDRFGISGAVISAVDLVNGIGRCAGLEVIDVPGATGYLDTDYEGKVSAALDALRRLDFVYLHVEAPDEASHEGKADLKVKAIEDFDARVVKPCFEGIQDLGGCRILVAPDHITSITSRTHEQGPVPFALWGPGVVKDERDCYSEEEAAKSGVVISRGHDLVPAMIKEETFAAANASRR